MSAHRPTNAAVSREEHWLVPPSLDARTWLAPQHRGRPAPEHRDTPERCPRCVSILIESQHAPSHGRPTRARHELGSRSNAIDVDALSLRELILLAARDVARSGHDATTARITVRAWQLAPKRIGLAGFEASHPDSNRVLAKLSGREGLCAIGWLRRTAPNTLRITRKGHARLRALAHAAELRRRGRTGADQIVAEKR